MDKFGIAFLIWVGCSVIFAVGLRFLFTLFDHEAYLEKDPALAWFPTGIVSIMISVFLAGYLH